MVAAASPASTFQIPSQPSGAGRSIVAATSPASTFQILLLTSVIWLSMVAQAAIQHTRLGSAAKTDRQYLNGLPRDRLHSMEKI
jgi:hypothetical protein